jgi:hypothetical protein
VIDAALDRETDGGASRVIPLSELPTVPKAEGSASANVSRDQLGAIAALLTDRQVEAVHTALRQLAGVCDGAVARDGAGFNGVDARIGHSLANSERLTKRQAALGKRIVQKYRRQLGDGILEVVNGG